MLNILGVDGTSSDETDEETESTKIHKVRRIPKPWRSNEIDILLRVLDKASREPDPLGRKPKGHQRRRLRTGDHPTLLNPNLISLKYPQNFYDMDWIKEHKPAVIELLTESWGVPLQLPVCILSLFLRYLRLDIFSRNCKFGSASRDSIKLLNISSLIHACIYFCYVLRL